MGKTFRVGRRFLKIKYLCVAVNSFVVFTFYFIYRYLLEPSFPDFANVPLALIFIAIGAAVAKATLWACDKYARAISYRLTGKGLVEVRGTSERLIPWDSFRGAVLRPYQFQGAFPVEFQVGDDTLILNQYIDGLCLLTHEIFQKIRGHASIDPALEKQAADMVDVY